MSEQTLAAVVTILLALRIGVRLGMPHEKTEWTSERSILAMLWLPYIVCLVWLLAKVLL